jgi:hypothetical protein
LFIPLTDVLGEIALLAVVVEDLSGIAVLFNWGHSFQADVILLAVCRVGIFGVGVFDELGGQQLGTNEPIFQSYVNNK